MGFTYNSSGVVLPDGKTRADAKIALRNSPLGQKERHLLLVVLDQAEGWIFRVDWPKKTCWFGDKAWVNCRDNLIRAGVLMQVKEVKNGVSFWLLTFDFCPVFVMADPPSYPQIEPKRGDRARVIPPKGRDLNLNSKSENELEGGKIEISDTGREALAKIKKIRKGEMV